MESIKILACGDVKGQFSKFFKKIGNLNKKNGPFEMVLCLGQFFTASDSCEVEWKACLDGKIQSPVPLFILGPTSSDHESFYSHVSLDDGGEMCHNITFLGRKGIYAGTSGLQIAYVSGMQATAAKKGSSSFQSDDIENMLKRPKSDKDFAGIDILLTSVWPKDVTKHSNTNLEVSGESKLISVVAAILKPRYHFTSHDEVHFERLPYRNHRVLLGKQEHVTRFISLAPFLNKDNKKFLYAFSISPMSKLAREELVQQPQDTTEFPYKAILHDKEEKDSQAKSSQQQYFFDQKKLEQSKKRGNESAEFEGKRKQPRGPPALTGPCWFCLGSPQVEKHLVISVGLQTYLALAKGGLTPDHVLICPIHHYHSTVVVPEETLMEIEKYKQSLRKFFSKQSMTLVIFERNFYTQHLQLQVVPIPKNKVDEAKTAFTEFGQMQNIDFADVPEDKDLQEMLSATSPYFAVEFDDGERLLHRIKSKIPLQFGREVLACEDLLNMPERVDWKSCKVSKDEETKMAKSFRSRLPKENYL